MSLGGLPAASTTVGDGISVGTGESIWWRAAARDTRNPAGRPARRAAGDFARRDHPPGGAPGGDRPALGLLLKPAGRRRPSRRMVSRLRFSDALVLDAGPNQVWDLLLDVDRFAACVPG